MFDKSSHKHKISAQLKSLLDENQEDQISLSYIVQYLDQTKYPLTTLALSLPNLIPIYIPGISVICGLPIIFLSYRVLRHQPFPQLPAFLANKSIERQKIKSILDRSIPVLERFEKALKTRWLFMLSLSSQKAISVLIILLSVLLLVPLPGTNIIPSFAIMIISIGLIEKDGLCVFLGVLMSVLSFIITIALIFIYISSISLGLGYLF